MSLDIEELTDFLYVVIFLRQCFKHGLRCHVYDCFRNIMLANVQKSIRGE